jgi:Haemolysin-type calcium binding protein related domain/RTX calcium-binding nonapeptide repeat (4 copies)
VNVENITLTGTTAINATGNASDNVITGNTANNTLNGGAGNDTINGGTGNDTMVGGAGNDIYFANVATDVVTELANEGTDTVNAAVTLTLGTNVENLTLTGTTAINGTGNTLNNVLNGNGANNTLTGNAGNDTLNGGAGTDTMVGGAGDDVYFVDVAADVVTEAASAGTDTVNAGITYTAGANVENVTLTGTAAINATGNTLNNVLVGNAGNNALAGLAGDDTYDGGAGADTMSDNSTTSADVYRWGLGLGNDSITDAGGTDKIVLGTGVTASQVTLTRSGNNLLVAIAGSADRLTVVNWYTNVANRIETIQLADGSVISGSTAPVAKALAIGDATRTIKGGAGFFASAVEQVDMESLTGEMPISRQSAPSPEAEPTVIDTQPFLGLVVDAMGADADAFESQPSLVPKASEAAWLTGGQREQMASVKDQAEVRTIKGPLNAAEVFAPRIGEAQLAPYAWDSASITLATPLSDIPWVTRDQRDMLAAVKDQVAMRTIKGPLAGDKAQGTRVGEAQMGVPMWTSATQANTLDATVSVLLASMAQFGGDSGVALIGMQLPQHLYGITSMAVSQHQ